MHDTLAAITPEDHVVRAGSASARTSPAETDLAEVMSVFNDVTARLESTHAQLRHEVARLHEQLRQANTRLERAKRLSALGEMAAGIAHEVRNPLGGIGLYAKMLEDDLADLPEQKSLATKIRGAVHGLEAIVQDVLSFASEMRLVLETTSVTDVLERASHDCRAEAQRRGVTLSIACDASLTADLDESRFRRAVVNLVRNAIEAAAEPGQTPVVLLEASRCLMDDRTTPAVRVAVVDGGPGIPDDVTERIFNPFFTTRATGTGLGLAIVHRVIDAHDGRLQVVRSRGLGENGRGARVELILPIHAQIQNDELETLENAA